MVSFPVPFGLLHMYVFLIEALSFGTFVNNHNGKM
jgi:hypothetical protein